jgi:hypothetical protein
MHIFQQCLSYAGMRIAGIKARGSLIGHPLVWVSTHGACTRWPHAVCAGAISRIGYSVALRLPTEPIESIPRRAHTRRRVRRYVLAVRKSCNRLDPRNAPPGEVGQGMPQAHRYLPVPRSITQDCGFAPFCGTAGEAPPDCPIPARIHGKLLAAREAGARDGGQ